MSLSVNNIEKILHAKRFGDSNATIDNVSIDSRSLQNNEKTLFFALVGPNNDAHIYISNLIEKGVQNFVVTHFPEELSNKAVFLVVENTLDALQQFATHHRRLFKFPVIGLTGSNGKTIVKEWLNFLLSPDFNIIRSPKSYNSPVGVPLSVISINDKHNLGIFEAGISKMNEMEKLEVIIRPTIGIITNIGTAHDEGFVDLEKKILEKLKLFKNSKIIIYQKNKAVDALIDPKIQAFSWSYDDKTADVFIGKKAIEDKTILQVRNAKANFEVEIPFQDEASVENAVTCLMVLLSFKYSKTTIQNRMKWLYPVEMRLKVKNGINNT
ncbi:MAG TPA: Mur ligase family protein, partial [Flavobacterium sp.]|nr:Mur ligase family protein [Flavobacterium sp.]